MLTFFFVIILLAVHWLPSEPISENIAISTDLLSSFPTDTNYLFQDIGQTLYMENEFAQISLLPENPEYSTLWNALVKSEQGVFWDGIQVLLRPLFSFFNIIQIHYLAMILFLILFFAVTYMIIKKLNIAAGLFFFLSIDRKSVV